MVPLWLLVAVPLFVLAGGLILYLFSGGQVDEQKQAAKHDRDQPLPAPHQESPPVEAPHALPKKEPEKPAVKLPMKPLDYLKPPVAMRPADQLVHLVENNMVLAGKALPGQPLPAGCRRWRRRLRAEWASANRAHAFARGVAELDAAAGPAPGNLRRTLENQSQ